MADRLTALAKNLRKQSTDTEEALWKYLRAKRMNGLKFKLFKTPSPQSPPIKGGEVMFLGIHRNPGRT